MRHGTALLKTIWTQSDTHVLELRQSLLKTMWKSDTHVLESFGENYNYLPRFLAPNVCSSTTHSNSVLNSLTTLLSSNAIFEEQRANPQWTKVLLIKASDLIEIPTPLMFFFSRASAKRGGQTSKRDIWLLTLCILNRWRANLHLREEASTRDWSLLHVWVRR